MAQDKHGARAQRDEKTKMTGRPKHSGRFRFLVP
jgi:hypothetical protein